MGIKISIFEGAVPRFPLEIELTLVCDGPQHGPEGGFLAAEAVPLMVRHSDGFMGCYRTAMAAGWKDTHRNGERVFFGPCCSGKAGGKNEGHDPD